jgi:hypothetical protein
MAAASRTLEFVAVLSEALDSISEELSSRFSFIYPQTGLLGYMNKIVNPNHELGKLITVVPPGSADKLCYTLKHILRKEGFTKVKVSQRRDLNWDLNGGTEIWINLNTSPPHT